MSSTTNEDREKQRTDEAWKRLQAKLAQEPVQPKWANWTILPESAVTHAEQQAERTAPQPAEPFVPAAALSGNNAPQRHAASGGRLSFDWLRKRRKQLAVATACCVLAAIIATPSGNEALAAILNKFRMQEVTVVQESDLRDLFNQITPGGQTREQINKFGTFTRTDGKLQGEFTPEEAANVLGRKLVVPAELKEGQKRTVYVSPSSKTTFQLHVDEVNKAMKQLGAKKLLPASVDGKPITLEIGETVNYSIRDEQNKKYASFSQQNVPIVTVDPSIPVSEALAAVLDFPLLPEHLKQGLKQSNVLSGGNVPLPVIANGETEKIDVNGTSVILSTSQSRERTYYYVTWVKDGQLFNFNGGNMYSDKASVLNKVKELIGS